MRVGRIQTLCDRAGVKTPEVAIRKLVKRLHQDYGKNQPPFSAYHFCEMANVRVGQARLPDCDARLLKLRDGWLAEVSSDLSRERQQFALCHEVGHTFFGSLSGELQPFIANCSVSNTFNEQSEEHLCNYAAVEMLMPERIFRLMIKDMPVSLSTVWSLAKIFQTSAQAVLGRIIDLGLWEVIVASFYPLEIRDAEPCFQLFRRRASKTAFTGYLGEAVVSDCLGGMAKSPQHLKNLGILEAFKTGKPVDGEFSIEPLDKSFSIQSFKNNYGVKPSVLSMITRRY